MCGRFDLHSSVHELVRLLQAEIVVTPVPHFNIAPTQQIAAVRARKDGKRELVTLRWGLVPGWSDGPSSRYSMINARAETVAEKPAYRRALRSRRCLIPADGFYEWQRTKTGKQPFYLCKADRQVFTMAGLWELWRGKDGENLESCTIITTHANDFVANVHDRMPVILESEARELWLAKDVEDPQMLLPLFEPIAAEQMTAWPVSTLVNSPRNDDPACTEAIDKSE